MLIHRTSYGFYNKLSEEKKVIEDCKRSNGNSTKVYHHVNDEGDIIETKYFDIETNTLKSITTTPEMKLKSLTLRKWVTEKHKIIDSSDSKKKKQDNFNKLCKKYHYPQETL